MFFSKKSRGGVVYNKLMQVNFLSLLIILGVIIVSMVIHEIMHAYTSYWLGDDTAKKQGRLSVNPIKHLDPFMSILLPLLLAISGGPIFGGAKPVPYNPNNVKWGDFGSALVALVGPLSNFLIAFLSYVILLISGDQAGLVGVILSYFVFVNLGFFIFNMLPIPPLDGSRVLYALAPDFIRRIMEQMERYGLLIVFALVLLAGSWLTRLFIVSQDAILNFFNIILMVN